MALELKLNFNWRTPPKPVRIVAWVVPIVVSVALCVFLVYMPKSKKIEKLTKDIEKQETEISKSQSMAAKLSELVAENAKLKEKLVELEDQLPQESEISSLLKQVTDLTREAGLSIQTWTPSARRNHSSGIVYEIPVAVTLTGNYHKLGMFFSSLTGLDRIVNISGITLSGARVENDEVILSVSFMAVTFTAVAEKRIM
ncbi:type 4a pilus biogenesis protein PilO [Nitrospirota bacterium]